MRIFARLDRGNAQSARSRLAAEIATLRHTLSIVSQPLISATRTFPTLLPFDRPEGESLGSLLDRLGEMLFIVLYECVGHVIAIHEVDLGGLAAPSSCDAERSLFPRAGLDASASAQAS